MSQATIPRISAVVPLYNKGPQIERTIASILAQTLPPHEIIVVDDGSTDGGLEYVRGLKIPNLRLLQRSPPGAAGSAARNLGIESAEGEWIALLDADDAWLPTHLEEFASTIAQAACPSETVMVFSGCLKVFADGHREADPFTAMAGGSGPVDYDFAGLVGVWLKAKASPVCTSSVVLRRQALLDAGLFPAGRCTRGEDKDTWLRVAYLGRSIFTGNVSAHYYWDGTNLGTKQPYANREPCLFDSVRRIMPSSPASGQTLLRRLANHEILAYAWLTTKYETLQRKSWAAFSSGDDPVGRLLLELLSLPPVSLALRIGAKLRR